MTKAKTISLFWDNTLHAITPDKDGRYSLTQLWDTVGHSMKHRPSLWLENDKTKQLVNEYDLKEGNPALRIVRGRGDRGAGTWAIEPLVYAYASWISAEFYKAVLDAFTAAVAGNMVKVKEIVRTAVHYSNWRRYRLVIT
ncbi:hypothetical protein CCO48_02450 [Salmonella enterica subsp. enterica serovar Altendorf]|uniref:KilA-N domain-containing protein n=1 Tax=Salmonella enterica TaxID=28901 RepID=UPI000BA03E7B|nr:KilA-N domain-containing protein [Salmonella enterica]OZU14474.1 hypothetical protein CCO48_02450 [Salmonella enterica subsp. enterica serovar Altendorf]